MLILTAKGNLRQPFWKADFLSWELFLKIFSAVIKIFRQPCINSEKSPCGWGGNEFYGGLENAKKNTSVRETFLHKEAPEKPRCGLFGCLLAIFAFGAKRAYPYTAVLAGSLLTDAPHPTASPPPASSTRRRPCTFRTGARRSPAPPGRWSARRTPPPASAEFPDSPAWDRAADGCR